MPNALEWRSSFKPANGPEEKFANTPELWHLIRAALEADMQAIEANQAPRSHRANEALDIVEVKYTTLEKASRHRRKVSNQRHEVDRLATVYGEDSQKYLSAKRRFDVMAEKLRATDPHGQ